jgi:hypothetical protein
MLCPADEDQASRLPTTIEGSDTSMADTISKPITETEWMKCTDLWRMIFGRDWSRASKRKMRLFGCACCRRLGTLLIDPNTRQALDLVEMFAEHGRNSDFVKAKKLARAAERKLAKPFEMRARFWDEGGFLAMADRTKGSLDLAQAHFWAAHAVTLTTYKAFREAFQTVAAPVAVAMGFAEGCAKEKEESIQADVLRDIFGNPFRPVAALRRGLKWRKGKVLKMAQAIYDSGEFESMPILAETLEKAGCNEDQILVHCRQSMPHARGCWAIDLVLNKE